MRTLAYLGVISAAILTAACGRDLPQPEQAELMPEALLDVAPPANFDAVLAECEEATGMDLRHRVTRFRFVNRTFPCGGGHQCLGLTQWNAGAEGTVVTVAMLHIVTQEPTEDARQTALIHEVAGHVAYGWPHHEHPSLAAQVVESLYADVVRESF